MLRLIGTDSDHYYAWELHPGRYTIGRKSDCDFAVADRSVSRPHARLDVEPDGKTCFLTDLQSHNGTAVNGVRIVTRTEIKSGDFIMFGRAEFKLTDDIGTLDSSRGKTPTLLSRQDPEKSVMLSMAEALKPLPARVTDLPELLPTLFDMAKMLVLPEPREVMLERSLELVAKLIPADRLAVLSKPDDTDEIYTAALILPEGKDPGSFTLSRTIIDTILTDKTAILIADAGQDPRFAQQQSIIMSELKSAMAAPLLDEDNVLGILYADTTNPVHRYNDDFLRLFATIGHIIASRLANYTLLRERQEKEIYEAELIRASNIQKKLLPREIPQVPGYAIHAFQEQCRAVGGDLYDVGLLPDGRLVFLIADVSGKGTGAALLMSNILASFRILCADDNFDLGRAVHQTSMQMYIHSAPEHFATLFVGVLDSRSHRLAYVNAGHNPPLLVRADGTLEYLQPSGTMIGAFDFCTWTEETAGLEPGDLLVTFTDGVTEAGADESEDEDYGDERLERLVVDNRTLCPEDLSCTILADVDKFMGDAPRTDDITLVILQRNI